MRTIVMLGLSLLLSASAVAGQSLEEEIRAEVVRFVETVNSGDPRAVADLYIDSPAVGSLGEGQIYQGWSTISALTQAVYRQVGSVRLTTGPITVMPLAGRAAIAYFRYRVEIGRDGEQAWWGAMTIVFQRTNEGWRVAHDHSSTLPPDVLPTLPPQALIDSGPPEPIRETSVCTIERIIDGDTIVCAEVGRVRLIGMDTPELSQEPYGRLAAEALAALTPVGMRVQLERDVELQDRYDRMLAYVWTDGTQVNWALVRQGWAVLLTYPPNVQYVDWYTEAQRRAREDGVGLWAVDGFDCLPVDRRRGRCD